MKTSEENSHVIKHGIFHRHEEHSYLLRCPRCGCEFIQDGKNAIKENVSTKFVFASCPECGAHIGTEDVKSVIDSDGVEKDISTVEVGLK